MKEQWLDSMLALIHGVKHHPHKLLVMISNSRKGICPHKILSLTPELAFHFSMYGNIVAHRRRLQHPFQTVLESSSMGVLRLRPV